MNNQDKADAKILELYMDQVGFGESDKLGLEIIFKRTCQENRKKFWPLMAIIKKD